MDIERLLSDRTLALDASGIRRAFELGASLKDPINLSIGQPDFPVPQPIKDAAKAAIDADQNGYTLTGGVAPLRERLGAYLKGDLGWSIGQDSGLVVTSGTSGALTLAMMAVLNPGDEIIVPDPYFLLYPAVARMCDAKAVRCDTYPDFRMTAERVEPLITERTKAVLVCSPSNPSGVVINEKEQADLLELCRRKGVLLISDEIYDEFTFSDHTTQKSADGAHDRCPTAARFDGAQEDVLVVRGFGKTYGVTGWRMGYAAGPKKLIEQIAKLQQYTYVCAPSIAQHACIAALDVDMGPTVERYKGRRDLVLGKLGSVTEIATPGGAFYAFVKVPEALGLTGSAFMERAVEKGVIVIPGGVFSERDTHIRISFACPDEKLERGLGILAELMTG